MADTHDLRQGDIAEESASHGQVRTFLFADIRGYTRFTADHGDAAAVQLVSRFEAVAEDVLPASGGTVIQYRGDEALAVFDSARQALRGAVELQHQFVHESSDDLPLKVGVGIDAGEAVPVQDGFLGAALNLAARLCSLAAAGEVLASETVTGIARKLEGLEYVDRGWVQLKGFVEPVRAYQVVAEGAQSVAYGAGAATERATRPQQLPIGGFLGALPPSALAGRDEEVRRLIEAVAAVAGGQGRCVVLAGEAGAGKTRLAQEATLELRDRGFVIAAGSCFEPQQTVPYFPFLDVLATIYGAISPSLRAQSPQRWPQLARMLPEAGLPVTTRSDVTEEQEWLRRAVVDFVRSASLETPIAILLDDLHWADEATLDLLQRLARALRGDRVLLLGTYRDVDAGQHNSLERTLRDVRRAGILDCIGVRPLSRDGTRSLMAASLETEIPDDFAGFLYGKTEGNPLFTQEFLHALIERGEVHRQDGHWEWKEIDRIDVPETVRSVIGERLSRLQEKSQELLSAASVLGQTFDFDTLQTLSDEPEADVEQALDEALRSGIIRETTDRYNFNHVLTQSTLYASLSTRRKRRLHLAAGEALERLPERRWEGREVELAHHFLEGRDPERALHYTLLAGAKAAAVFAHAEAARQYARARDLACALGDERRLAEALRGLGTALSRSGRYDTGALALEEAMQLSREANDLNGEIEAVISLLRHAPERGKHQSTAGWVEPLLPRLDQVPDSPEKLAFFNGYAYYLVQAAQFDTGLKIATRTVEMAGAMGDEYGQARAKVILGHLLLWHGRADETRTILEPIVPYLERTGDKPNAMRAASLLAQVGFFSGDSRIAMIWRTKALELARQVGDAAQAVYETCMIGYQRLRGGDMELAWEVGKRAVAEARELDQSTMPGSPLGLLANLSLIQGRSDDLERYAGEMIALSDYSDEPWWRRHGEFILAQHDLLEGQPERALARLEQVMAGARVDIQEETLYLPALAEACLSTGDLLRAEEVLEAPLALRRPEMRGMLTETLRVHAMVQLARGKFADAEKSLQELLDLTRWMPYLLGEAQALFEYARLEMARSNAGTARGRLNEALAIFERLGAAPFIKLATQLQVSLRGT